MSLVLCRSSGSSNASAGFDAGKPRSTQMHGSGPRFDESLIGSSPEGRNGSVNGLSSRSIGTDPEPDVSSDPCPGLVGQGHRPLSAPENALGMIVAVADGSELAGGQPIRRGDRRQIGRRDRRGRYRRCGDAEEKSRVQKKTNFCGHTKSLASGRRIPACSFTRTVEFHLLWQSDLKSTVVTRSPVLWFV